jgi:hypothetical protein
VDVLQNGAEWLNESRHACATKAVTYWCTSQERPIELLATIGRSEFAILDNAGIERHVETRDYIIRAADLQLDGTPVVPTRGDYIMESFGEAGNCTYSVLSPGDAPCWRYSDPYRQMMRIHTKLTSEAGGGCKK